MIKKKIKAFKKVSRNKSFAAMYVIILQHFPFIFQPCP